jgi:hypothetical protein
MAAAAFAHAQAAERHAAAAFAHSHPAEYFEAHFRK